MTENRSSPAAARERGARRRGRLLWGVTEARPPSLRACGQAVASPKLQLMAPSWSLGFLPGIGADGLIFFLPRTQSLVFDFLPVWNIQECKSCL